MGDRADQFDLSTRRPIPDPNPPGLLGWPTKRLVALDALAPGLLARLLSAAPMSRQAIFAAVAQSPPATDDAAFAQTLRDGRARDIVCRFNGKTPAGLLGAYARLGGEPLPRHTDYDRLLRIFTEPAKRQQARALRHCGKISKLTLDALSVLDLQWATPSILMRARDLREVVEFQAAIRLLQSMPHGPSDAAIHAALAAMGPKYRLGSVVGRLIRRAPAFGDQPLQRDADFEPLDSAAALIAATRRFRNCLRHRIVGALTGRCAYAVFRDGIAIAEFRRLGDGNGWVLVDVHAPKNDSVPPEVRAAVHSACDARGLLRLTDGRETREWLPLISMAEQDGLYDW